MMGSKHLPQVRAIAVAISASFLLTGQVYGQESTFADAFGELERPPLPLEADQGSVDMAEISPPIGDGSTVIQDMGSGTASYYGRRFHGRLTASGEIFDMHALTAAHRTLPFGTLVRVTNPKNGRSVIVRINDRGPFIDDRVIDLSRAAAREIGLIRPGHAHVQLALVE